MGFSARKKLIEIYQHLKLTEKDEHVNFLGMENVLLSSHSFHTLAPHAADQGEG